MAKKIISEPIAPKSKPALNPESQENKMIALAMNLVEERLRNGTASSQETTHFLKLGSEKERLEREKLQNENLLLKAKTEALESAKRVEELYSNAMLAFTSYQPTQEDVIDIDIPDKIV